MQIHAGGANDEVDVRIGGEVLGGAVSFCGRGEVVDLDGFFGGVEGGVAEGDDLVFGGGGEVGEVGPDGPGLGA